jgi:hypothetical protein
MADSWIICEASGRWAAALRAHLARRGVDPAHAKLPLRVREVRHFEDFQTSTIERRFTLGLLEVQCDNLSAALNFLSADRRSELPIVALLDESLQDDVRSEHRRRNSFQIAADALSEAGALATVTSPRRIAELFGLAPSLAAAQMRSSAVTGTHPSFAEWAQAALPWQDE